MLSSGGDPLQLTIDSVNKTVEGFTPDGTQILYNAGGDGIWSIPTLGGMPSPIATGSAGVSSPDANTFYFVNTDLITILRKSKAAVGEQILYSFAEARKWSVNCWFIQTASDYWFFCNPSRWVR